MSNLFHAGQAQRTRSRIYSAANRSRRTLRSKEVYTQQKGGESK